MKDVDRTALRVLRAEEELRIAKEQLRVAVRNARGAGATWEQIGDALGCSKQSACKRFKEG